MKRIAYFLLLVLFALPACSPAPASEASNPEAQRTLVPALVLDEPSDSAILGAAGAAAEGAVVPPLCEAASDADTAAFAAEVIRLVNEERAKVGAAPLTAQSQLTQAAQKHAIDMACNDAFGHDGSDGSTMSSRLADFGYVYSRAGENVAGGYETPADVMAGWMSSEGHRRNILNPNFTEIGIGYVIAPNNMFGFDMLFPAWVMDLGTPK